MIIWSFLLNHSVNPRGGSRRSSGSEIPSLASNVSKSLLHLFWLLYILRSYDGIEKMSMLLVLWNNPLPQSSSVASPKPYDTNCVQHRLQLQREPLTDTSSNGSILTSFLFSRQPAVLPPASWGSCPAPCHSTWRWGPGGRGCPRGRKPASGGQRGSERAGCWGGASAPWTWRAPGPAGNRGNRWRTAAPGKGRTVKSCSSQSSVPVIKGNMNHQGFTSVCVLPSAASEW